MWLYEKFPEKDFYYFAGTDTYARLDKILNFLQTLNPKENLYIGGHGFTRYDTGKEIYYHSGGSGFILSNSLMKTIYPYILDWIIEWNKNVSWIKVACDWSIAALFHEKKINVKTIKLENFKACNWKGLIKGGEKCCKEIDNEKVWVWHYMEPSDMLKIEKDIKEMKSINKMKFEELIKIPYFDENNNVIDHFSIETNEQKQAWNYVPEDATVLELGARYGTVSCLINHKLRDSKRQVSVEPDLKVIPALYKNKELHGCNFIIFEGVISNINMKLCQDNNNGYGNFCTPSNDPSVQNISLTQLIQKTGLNFDVLVADCEGFLEQFFEENRDYIPNFKVIMFERDYPNRCNYAKIETYLLSLGFKCINQLGHMHVVYSK